MFFVFCFIQEVRMYINFIYLSLLFLDFYFLRCYIFIVIIASGTKFYNYLFILLIYLHVLLLIYVFIYLLQFNAFSSNI